MKYIIMLTIVVGMAASDFVTGIIKAYIQHNLNSRVMREGGMHKLSEIIVMSTICGLEIGIDMLGRYYNAEVFAKISGTITASLVFAYIVIMEVISVLENYAEINPDAKWAKKFLKRLKSVTFKDDDEEEK